jgi:uncharacterized protein (TIGR02246 family)
MDAKKFLQTYTRAWETRDAELAASLFAKDAIYQETPFEDPRVGVEAIRAYWQGATAPQKEIDVLMREPTVVENTVIAEWGARYTHAPTGERRELRGILIAEFEEGEEKVTSFREYWHRRTL